MLETDFLNFMNIKSKNTEVAWPKHTHTHTHTTKPLMLTAQGIIKMIQY